MSLKKSWQHVKYPLRSFTLGVIFTFAVLYLAINFYSESIDERERHPNILVRLFHRLDQATVDWKLRFRGPRAGSDRIVILAIDEKALAQEGQWPWPRRKIKTLVKKLEEGGAAVIGFDMTWPESEQNVTGFTLENLRKEIADADTIRLIDRYRRQASGDEDFGRTVGRFQERLILGSYFDPPPIAGFRGPEKGYKNLCFEHLYRTSPAYEAWSTQDSRSMVLDQTVDEVPRELPAAWGEELSVHFAKLDVKTANEFMEEQRRFGVSGELGRASRIELQRLQALKRWEYCERWLEPADENLQAYQNRWDEVREEDEALGTLVWADGVRMFRDRYFNSRVQMVGDWVLNIPELQSRSLYTGYFNALQDSDGTIRRASLMVRSGTSFFPSMSLLTYLVATDQRVRVVVQEGKKSIDGRYKVIDKIDLLDEEGNLTGGIPVDREGMMTINYAGRQQMFAHLSAADVLSEEPFVTVRKKRFSAESGGWEDSAERKPKADFYKDKIFLAGATAIGIYDLRVTPFEENFPGVETHANVIDNLLRGDFLKRHSDEEQYMVLFLAVFGAVLSLFLSGLGAVSGIVFGAAALVSIFVFDWLYIFSRGTIVSIVFPLTLLVGVYSAITVFKYFTEARNKKKLKGTFSKYVSPAIVEEILAHPDNIELGGRKEEVTVFFSDVRGFTTISETLSPTELGDVLNEYLTPMTEIIFKNRGTLDKYIGDAIMAFFGAPIHNPRHAEDACRAALQNVTRLKAIQEEFQRRGLPHIDIGIGLNTGDVSVGNMGSNIVRNYTVMGDAVNLGARLEGITKEYGAKIILSEFTASRIGSDFVTREVDRVRVKGKNQPVRIFELIGEGKAPENMDEVIKWFGEGYSLYHAKQWAKAAEVFRKAQEARTGKPDPASEIYVHRCLNYIENPPVENWDGVYVMKTK